MKQLCYKPRNQEERSLKRMPPTSGNSFTSAVRLSWLAGKETLMDSQYQEEKCQGNWVMRWAWSSEERRLHLQRAENTSELKETMVIEMSLCPPNWHPHSILRFLLQTAFNGQCLVFRTLHSSLKQQSGGISNSEETVPTYIYILLPWSSKSLNAQWQGSSSTCEQRI